MTTRRGSFTTLQIEHHGPVAWLLYSSEPRNAWNWTMLQEQVEALRQLSIDDATRVIVLASDNPDYFSVGADLALFEGISRDEMARWIDLCHDGVRLIRQAPKPVLAAINGMAVGGGLEFTYHADIRFASSEARLGQPEIAVGFIPPCGATVALSRLIGRSNAIRYLYDGALHSAEDAKNLGLVDEVLEPERLRDHVQTYASSLAMKSARGLAVIRQTINGSQWSGFQDSMALEKKEAVELSQTTEFKNGIAAFLDRRR